MILCYYLELLWREFLSFQGIKSVLEATWQNINAPRIAQTHRERKRRTDGRKEGGKDGHRSQHTCFTPGVRGRGFPCAHCSRFYLFSHMTTVVIIMTTTLWSCSCHLPPASSFSSPGGVSVPLRLAPPSFPLVVPKSSTPPFTVAGSFIRYLLYRWHIL